MGTQERAWVLMNQQIEGDGEAGEAVGNAFMEGDFELLRELVRQWDYLWNVTGKWRYPQSGALYRAWREYRSEGVPLPPWEAVVERAKVKGKCTPRHLRRCRKEIGADILPSKSRGRPASKIRTRK
jgi:hypothetical protein